mgnify:CR=1 FL=1
MELNNVTSIRQMTTEQLRDMLDKELHTEPVNGDSIRLIRSILQDRNRNITVEMTPNLERAWEKYQRDTEEIWKSSRRSRRIRSWAMRAAAAAAVLVLLLVPIMPQEVGAESFWDALVRWTTEIVEFFGPKDNEHRIVTYEFKTDNPGLQQVYDAVVELGVTDPVVPMWLPEGYELSELEIVQYPVKTRIHSRLENGDGAVVFNLDIYSSDAAHMYQKNDNENDRYEHSGVVHQILHNYDMMAAVWSRDNVECFLSIPCQEEMLHKVLKSIYTSEEN